MPSEEAEMLNRLMSGMAFIEETIMMRDLSYITAGERPQGPDREH